MFHTIVKTTLRQNIITCGVPQGSILVPLFFILYVNNLSNVSHKIFFVLFADYTNMFMQGNNLHKLIAELQTELTKVIEWLNINN